MTSTMQRRDKIIPWYFVMFFTGIAAVNGVMITLAVRSHTGTVTEHPYEKGLAYNKIVKAEEKQEALGWRGEISYSKGMLDFSLRNRQQQLLVPQKVTATITRPTQAGMDFFLELKGAHTPVVFPAKGLWEVRLDTIVNGQHYQQAKRIVVE